MDKSYYVSKDLAKLLEVSEATIYKYIKDGKVIPYNKETWNIDGEYRFSEEEALKGLEAQEEKPGMTTKDIAEQLGITAYTVSRHIKSGKLPAEKIMYKGLERYFVTEEDFHTYASSIQETKQEKVYNKDLEFYLFEPLYNHQGELVARVLNAEEPVIQSKSGKELSVEEALPLQRSDEKINVMKGKIVRKPGYAVFSFPKSDNIFSSTYQFMHYLISHVHINNVIVKQEDSMITFMVRSFDVPFPEEESIQIEEMMKYLVKGTWIQRPNSFYIDSETEVVQANIHSDTKGKLKREAIAEGLSMNDYVGKLLNHLYEDKSNRNS
ncbi:helix-turn-helix domain-containing protein [Alteribacillus sp. HJP-4]|uniref:helix-turn-helix domain-containing protein n=1 Tax=Alteribacillus sp. HJP-4 TaxID=2775394 RepID=UPI0035CD27BE